MKYYPFRQAPFYLQLLVCDNGWSVHKCSLTLPIWEAGLVLSLYRVDRVVPSFSFLFILEVLFGYRDQIIC